MFKKSFFTAGAVAALISTAAQAEDYTITIKDHQFSPLDLKVPAGQKIKVIVKNNDATDEEFESSDLDREKIVSGNGQITVLLGPLDAGSYKYFGDFHRDTANGTITAK